MKIILSRIINNHRKIRVKSKSQIKNISNTRNILYLNNQNSKDQINNLISIQNNKNNKNNNIIFNPSKKADYPPLIKPILDDETLNLNTIDNNTKYFKENSIELNKTIKIHHIKKEKEEIKKIKIKNNSFSGGKIIRKIKV